MVDDWWKAKTRDVERKGCEKGNRKAEAITERLAVFLFDRLPLGRCPSVDPTYPPKVWRCVLAYLTAASIKAGVGSRIGPPTRGAGVTCPAHTIDVASQVSTVT